MEFQHCFYESLLKIKKVSNTGILLLELDMSCYEETLLKLNMESANIFVRVMKKLLHLISIPTSILKGHVQDQDILSLDRQYVLQVMKLRSDYYRIVSAVAGSLESISYNKHSSSYNSSSSPNTHSKEDE